MSYASVSSLRHRPLSKFYGPLQARSELELKARETELAAMQQQLAVATAHRYIGSQGIAGLPGLSTGCGGGRLELHGVFLLIVPLPLAYMGSNCQGDMRV